MTNFNQRSTEAMPDQTSEPGLWKVEARETRTCKFYVKGPNIKTALEDAKELASSLRDEEWDDTDRDVDVEEATRAPEPGAWIWTGGPDGSVEFV